MSLNVPPVLPIYVPVSLHDDETLTAFRRYQQRKGLAPTTVEFRDRKLRTFGAWLGRPIATATTGEIERFLDLRKETGGCLT